MAPVLVIDLYPPCIYCAVCGAHDLSRWGIPVSSETAQIISNDSDEDWGGVPACESCWERHAAGEFVGEYPRY